MSEVSGRALNEAVGVAQQTGAQLHVLHVIESAGLSVDLLDTKVSGTPARTLRALIEADVQQQFRAFLAQSQQESVKLETHLLWGSPANQTLNLATQLGTDLIVLGTVGRNGVEGLLLGNTAESVLVHCDCDVLAVKPAGFVSPISPASWQLHPGREQS